MKILLVDDSKAVAGLYRQMLEGHGYDVVTAHSGTEALEVAQRELPDIGLIDYHLPDFTGEELTRRLLAHPVNKDMVISMLSTYSDVTRKSLDAGAIDMITKETPEELFLLRMEALERKVLIERKSQEQLTQMEQMQRGHSTEELIPFKVLFVDDSRFARSAYQAMLEDSGCEVLVAENMAEALEVARREHPDLAIVDFYMKGGNGDELTRALLEDPVTQNVMVVVLTSQMEIKDIALAAGAVDVIYKGEQQGSFLQRIASIREYRQLVARQIQHHMRSAEEAKRLHDWVDSILSSMNEPIMVIDSRGMIIHTNPASERLMGEPAGEILGRRMSTLFTEEGEIGYQANMLERMGGRLQQLHDHEHTHFMQLLKSAPIPLVIVDLPREASGLESSQVSLVNHEMEKLLGYEQDELDCGSILSLVMESEQEKIRQVLGSADGGLRCMGYKGCRWCSRSGEPIPASVCMVSIEGQQTTHVILLVKTDETLDQDLLQMTPFGRLFVESDQALDDFSPSLSADRTLRCRDGSPVPVHVSGALLSHSSGQSTMIEGAVLVLHDLSARLREEQQQQYLAFRSGIAEMSASILHNIGNTLVGLGGRINAVRQKNRELQRLQRILKQLSEGGELDPEANLEALRVSANALEKISGVDGVEADLRDIDESVRRIEKNISVHRSASKSDLSSSRFHFRSVVEDALFLLKEPLYEAKIDLQVDLSMPISPVEMPRNPAMQMVLNVLQNSIDAVLQRRIAERNPDWRGEIQLSIRSSEEGQFEFLIRDNGCGIEPEHHPHLFNQGYTTKMGGSGFGLHSAGVFVQGQGNRSNEAVLHRSLKLL